MNCMKPIAAVFLFAALASAETKFGKALSGAAPMPIDKLNREAPQWTGRTVKVKGRVTEVCQKMGCWLALVDPSGNAAIKVKVVDGEIMFPKESAGRMAIAEGKLEKFELTREQAVARARHEAEEQGRKFDPASVKSGAVVYQIAGAGAVLLD